MNNAPEGYMKNAAGDLIAMENVKDIDLARDELVKEIAAKIKAANAQLRDLKASLMDDVDAFVALSLERYGVKLGGKKGNVTLDSFDGQFQVCRQVGENIVFDERLQAAKALIDECLRDWTRDTRGDLRTLVERTFRVDKTGKLNVGAILGLRSLEISDERWQRAMTAISDSIKVTGTRPYLRLYERDEHGRKQPVSLDFAAL